MSPATRPLYKQILYTRSEVNDRIKQLAQEIVSRYKGTDPLFICLLNGAQPFTFKLMSAINRLDPLFHPNVQSMIVSRYGADRTPGQSQLITDLPPAYRSLDGCQVVILDDLIDEGSTIDFTEAHLKNYGAKSVDYVVLVKKIKALAPKVSVTMYGFEAPDVWLTGMGMDDERLGKEANRWAEWIAIADDD